MSERKGSTVRRRGPGGATGGRSHVGQRPGGSRSGGATTGAATGAATGTATRGLELLAPAGGLEAGWAALQYGADAVYLGLKRFSARADAANFELDEVEALLARARSAAPRRRVFVAVNTLVLERELPNVIETLGALAEVGVDAVIVQDLGVARLARRHFPELALHASTQLAVHSREGVETLRGLGFARATLARELTLDEIRDIASVPGIEVETFLHGALCYSYSGLCLFSSQLLGRSGNRGSCAYPCRDRWEAHGFPERRRDGQPFRRDPSQGFACSMKDLALPDWALALRDAGVASLKIEGRKKSPLYVAATVDFYRRLLDGELSPEERARREEDLQTIFARPWTSLYLRSPRDKEVADPDLVGHRGARIGRVEAVVRREAEVRIRFATSRRLERHDGLQIELPEGGRPFGFAVDSLWIAGERSDRPLRATEAPAGTTVEVPLPDGYPTIPIGAPISCSSSQEVKARYRIDSPRTGAPLNRFPVRLRLEVTRDRLRLEGWASPTSWRPRRDGDDTHGAEERRGGGAEARTKGGGATAPASGAGPGPEPRAFVHASVERSGSFERAREPAATATAARKALGKLGDTRLALESLEVVDPEGLFVPISALNEARRELAGLLETRVRETYRQRVRAAQAELEVGDDAPTTAPADLRPAWRLKVDRLSYLDALEDVDFEGVEELVLEVGRDSAETLIGKLVPLRERLGPDRLRLALPILARGWESKALRRKVETLRAAGFQRWEGANLAALGLFGPREGLEWSADWPLYVVNSSAARQLGELGANGVVLSPEDGAANVRELLHRVPDATLVVYQDSPLFISESCAFANLAGGCPGRAACGFTSMELVSSHGGKTLAVDDRCRTVLLSDRPLNLVGRLRDLQGSGVRRIRADFVYRPYTAEQVRDLWRRLRSGALVQGHVANWERGLG